jgi:hypothetical protein
VTMTVRMTDHVTAMTVADATVTTTAVTTAMTAAMRTCVSAGGDQRRDANDGRCDESKDCRTIEHCRRPFGSMWAIRVIGRSSRAAGSSD